MDASPFAPLCRCPSPQLDMVSRHRANLRHIGDALRQIIGQAEQQVCALIFKSMKSAGPIVPGSPVPRVGMGRASSPSQHRGSRAAAIRRLHARSCLGPVSALPVPG